MVRAGSDRLDRWPGGRSTRFVRHRHHYHGDHDGGSRAHDGDDHSPCFAADYDDHSPRPAADYDDHHAHRDDHDAPADDHHANTDEARQIARGSEGRLYRRLSGRVQLHLLSLFDQRARKDGYF